MPKLLLSIPDTDRTITRPVTMSVIKDLLNWTHLPNDTQVIYPGEIGSIHQPGSAMSESRSNVYGATNQLFIEVSEQFFEPEAGINATSEPSNQFLFDDNELGIYLRPNYTFTEVRVSVRYRAHDRVSAKRWRDEVRNKVLMGREAFVHDVDYSYRIPEVAHLIFKELHALRENKYGYGDDFKSWFEAHSNPRITLAANQSGKYDEYVISETLRRVQGWFDFTLEPEQGQYSDNQRSWEIGFEYIFQYDKASTMTFGYPIVVHNQLLSAKYRDRESKFEEQNHSERLSLTLHGLRYFESTDISWRKLLSNGVAIPGFDDFIPTSVPVSTRRVFSALIRVPETNEGDHIAQSNTKLLNLNNLGRFKLKDHILDFLKSESPYLTTPYKSFFLLSLFRNRNLANATNSSKPLRVDEELGVYSNYELNLRQAHRLRLSIVTDPYILDKDAWDRLRQNACVLRDVILAIYPWIDLSFLKPIGGECGIVPEDQWNDLLDRINRTDKGMARWFDTVSTMFVQSCFKSE